MLAGRSMLCLSFTHAALQRSSVDIVTGKLTDSNGGIFVSIHLDEREPAISRESGLNNVAEVLEERNNVILSRVRSEVADVASSLPSRSLSQDHLIALCTLRGKLMMTAERGRRAHSHSCHGLLLRDGRLALLIGPVAANGARAKPFSIHRAQCLFSIRAIAKSNEAVTTRATGLHVPHDTSFGDGTKGRKGLEENFIIHFVAQIPNENMVMIRGIFLVGIIGLVSPVDSDFLGIS